MTKGDITQKEFYQELRLMQKDRDDRHNELLERIDVSDKKLVGMIQSFRTEVTATIEKLDKRYASKMTENIIRVVGLAILMSMIGILVKSFFDLILK